MLRYIHSTDIAITNWIHKNLRNRACDISFPIITSTGNFGMIWLVYIAYFLFFKKDFNTAIELFCALAACGLLGSLLMKKMVKRERPFSLDKKIDTIIVEPKDYSFPSGHTSSSFAAASVLCYVSVWLGITAIIIATVIAFSRLYLCVHYLSDVIAGLILGIVVGVSVHILLNLYLF